MKIIVAGFSKTGTKSLNVALSKLGYDVYDFMEHMWFHGEDWKKIVGEGTGSVEDFKRMYKFVDVVMDNPVFVFWEEIHQAFPEAKIIFTTRDEESWFKSLKTQFDEYNKNWFVPLSMLITPTGWKLFRHLRRVTPIGVAGFSPMPLRRSILNEMLARHLFRQHSAYVLQKAPKDKLLVYNISEGWEPLCTFLGKDVPNEDFPHENIGGKAFEGFLKANPAMQRMKREFLVSSSLILVLSLYGGYKTWKNGLFGKVLDFVSSSMQNGMRALKI